MFNDVYSELREWGNDGLIPPVKDSDIRDQVLATVLKAIREHIVEQREASNGVH